MKKKKKTTPYMKLHISICCIALLLLSACTGGMEEAVSGTPDGGTAPKGTVCVEFAADGLVATRTVLPGSDDLQHVEEVYLYVYDESGRCVWKDDVHWSRPAPDGSQQQHYWMPLNANLLLAGHTYTFVAVGMDDRAADTYGLPDPTLGADGWPAGWGDDAAPAGLKLSATADATGEETLRRRISQSEIFAGQATHTISGEGYDLVHVDLYRRVAGVLAYFTNIPAWVDHIRLVAHDAQRTDVPLLPVEGNDFGTASMEGGQTEWGNDPKVVLEMSAKVAELSAAENEDGLPKLVGATLRTAYMLPLPAPAAGGHTFTLELRDASGGRVETRNVVCLKETGEAGTADTAEGAKTAFAIEANHFYSIGRKDATTDDPYDLGGYEGNEVVIYVDGNWQAEVNIPM